MSTADTPARIGIYERGMWTHVNNLRDLSMMTRFRSRIDEDSQAEAPLYGLGPLTFIEELISDPIETMPPTFVAILRRYRGAIVDPVRAEYARSRKRGRSAVPEQGGKITALLE
jgi:hypothetical protein